MFVIRLQRYIKQMTFAKKKSAKNVLNTLEHFWHFL